MMIIMILLIIIIITILVNLHFPYTFIFNLKKTSEHFQS